MFWTNAARALLRQQPQRQWVTRTLASSSSAAAPLSVKDMIVNLTVVDPSGARKKITGIVGTYIPYIHTYTYMHERESITKAKKKQNKPPVWRLGCTNKRMK